MASLEPNLDSSHSDTLQESNQKKRRKIGGHDSNHQNSPNHIRWRSETEQRIYSSKLVDALRHVLRRTPSPTTKPIGGREVRETADRVLAATAKGRSRWSRAILATTLSRWRFQKHHKKVKKAAAKGLKKPEIRKQRRSLPAVQKKARVLSRLVPGCRKISFPNLLEETTDYISALEMQVRAMTALTELLTGAGDGDGDGAPADRLLWARP